MADTLQYCAAEGCEQKSAMRLKGVPLCTEHAAKIQTHIRRSGHTLTTFSGDVLELLRSGRAKAVSDPAGVRRPDWMPQQAVEVFQGITTPEELDTAGSRDGYYHMVLDELMGLIEGRLRAGTSAHTVMLQLSQAGISLRVSERLVRAAQRSPDV